MIGKCFHFKYFVKWNEWCLAMILHSKAILGWGQTELMRWILLWIMPMAQDRSLELLTSSPACYHCSYGCPLQVFCENRCCSLILTSKSGISGSSYSCHRRLGITDTGTSWTTSRDELVSDGCKHNVLLHIRTKLQMNGVLGHDSALQVYAGLETTWANEMNLVLNHAPGAGPIARPVGRQFSVLPLYHGCPTPQNRKIYSSL